MAKNDVHRASRGFGGYPRLPKCGQFPQVHRGGLDSVPEVVAQDTNLLTYPVTCDILSMRFKALFWWLGFLSSNADARLVQYCEQFIMPFDFVEFHAHNDQDTPSPTPRNAPEFIMSR